MRTTKLLLNLFLSVCVAYTLLTSCTDEYGPKKTELLLIASETVKTTEGIAYWVKTNKSDTWEMMHTGIGNFNHEKGYEYVVKVGKRRIKNPGADQSNHKYWLIKIISKEKKNSEVPLFTTKL